MSFLERLLGVGGGTPQPQQLAPQQQAQPMGRAPVERRGMFGMNFSDPQTAAALQMISNGLTPSIGAPRPMFQGVQQVTANAMGLQEAKRRREMEDKKMQDETMRKSRSLGWIEQNAPDYLPLVDAGLFSASDVAKMVMGGNKDEFAKRADVAGQYGLSEGTPEYQAFVLTGKYSTSGEGGPKYGMSPVYLQNPDGSVAVGQLTDTGQLNPSQMPDGYQVLSPYEKSRQTSQGKEEGKSAAERPGMRSKAMSSMQALDQQRAIVTDDIGRSIQEIRGSPNLTTGLVGGLSRAVPGTPAYALAKKLETIKANVGFDKLQSMRENSPTGGALGQVSDFENRQLQSVFGNLEQAQTAEDVIYNLRRLQEILTQSRQSRQEAFDRDFGGTGQDDDVPDPVPGADIEALIDKYGG